MGAGAVPTFDVFKRYARFTPDVGDFGMSQHEFRRFLADVGLGGLGGMISGDTGILFKQNATKNYLTYDGACKACRVIYDRVHSQRQMNCAAVPPINDRKSHLIPPVKAVGIINRGSEASGNRALLPGMVPPTELLIPKAQREAKDEPGPAPESTPSTHGRKPGDEDLSNAPPAIIKAANDRAALRAIRKQHFPEESTEWASIQQQHNQYAAVKLLLEEPNLIREVVPPPKTPSLRVQNAVASVQSAISQADMFLARSALEEVERSWINELAPKAAPEGQTSPPASVHRQPSRRAGSAKKAAKGNETERTIPKEGMAFIHLQHVSVSLSNGQLPQAEEQMDRAWHFVRALGEAEHIYYLLALFMDGLVSYFTNHYERGAELFQSCVDYVSVMHSLEWRSNAAAACNNTGVCYQCLGERGKALKSFEASQKMLHAIGCGESDSRQVLVKKNIGRLLRSGAMPKAASPHVPADSGLESQARKTRTKFLAFLKDAVPTRLKSVGIPEKKKKKKKKKAKASKAEENKPDKKKAAAPKKKKLGVMLLPPKYALQGVGALAPKKKKGRKK